MRKAARTSSKPAMRHAAILSATVSGTAHHSTRSTNNLDGPAGFVDFVSSMNGLRESLLQAASGAGSFFWR
jgi:hypothetical protein